MSSLSSFNFALFMIFSSFKKEGRKTKSGATGGDERMEKKQERDVKKTFFLFLSLLLMPASASQSASQSSFSLSIRTIHYPYPPFS